jgi:uncharacterized protein involved in cysteine biosynthesis
MSHSLTQGASYALTGLRWLPKAGLRGFVALPLLINSVLFGAGIWWSAGQLERLDQAVQHWIAGVAGLAALAVVAAVHPDRAGGGVLHLYRGGERDRRAV